MLTVLAVHSPPILKKQYRIHLPCLPRLRSRTRYLTYLASHSNKTNTTAEKDPDEAGVVALFIIRNIVQLYKIEIINCLQTSFFDL